jgi:hypothetical protein
VKPRNACIALTLLALAFAGVGAGSGSASVTGDFSISSSIGASKLAKSGTLSGSVVWTASPSGTQVAKVVFSIDGTDTWTEFTAPYRFNGDPNGVLDTSRLTNGQHKLGVKAYASDGRAATTQASLTISNTSVQTTFAVGSSIADGATLSGSLPWTASPSGSPVSKVEFLIDGVLKWTASFASFRFNGDNGMLDTSRLSDGGHTLAVKAYAVDGRTAKRTASVRIANGSIQATPFAVGSSIANGATIAGSLAWTASPSGSLVSKVEFLIDGAVRWTESLSPYQFNGDNSVLDTSRLSNGGHVLTVIAYTTDGRTASASSSVTVANNVTPPPPPPSLQPPPTTIPSYGFALGGKSLFRTAADRAFELDQIAAAVNGHPAVVRMDSTPGNQPYLDSWVVDARARGLEPMLLLFSNMSPVAPQTAANFAAAQGTKWKGKIRLYEFANEPDLNGWTPEQYTASLKATYVALKTADPNAILISGALWKWDAGPTANPSGGAREWVKRMYAAGAKGYFDMLSLHLYDDPDDHGSWNLWDQAFTMSPSIRSIMDANGDRSVPIVSTESGGPATKYGEAGQATIIDHDFNHLYAGQIRMCLVYTMLNDDVSGFGLLRDDRSRRPAWYTLQSRAT